jgi:GT2 family glycosyltransferase
MEAMKMNKTVSVIVTYNRKELLYECMEALLHQTVSTDILVVDNASTDNTKEYIAPLLSKDSVHYHNTKKNLGGAGGFHIGMKIAMKKGYDYVWIMDDDTIPEPTALEEIFKADQILDGKYGFLASAVLWTDGQACLMNIPGVSKKWLQGTKNDYVEQGMVGIKHASFVSVFFPREIIQEVGLPIKEFFIWNDDFEYTTRISQNHDCYYVSRSKVCHKMKANTETDIVKDSPDRLDRYFYGYRNEYYTIKKFGAVEKMKYYFKILSVCFRVLKSDCPAKRKRIGIVLKGVVSGWFFRPSVEKIG